MSEVELTSPFASSLIAAIASKAVPEAMRKPGDYVGPSGEWFCGRCHTPKEFKFMAFDAAHSVPCLCKCESDRRDANEKHAAEFAKERSRELIQEAATPNGLWHNAVFKADDKRDPFASGRCEEYAAQFAVGNTKETSLMLYGDVGCGKTFLAACIANAVAARGIEVRMDTLSNICARMFKDFGDERQNIVDSLNTLPLIVIDDFGAERATPTVLEQVYTIVNTRYNSQLPMVITTNISPKQMMAEKDIAKARIYDRLFQMCEGVGVTGASRRRK